MDVSAEAKSRLPEKMPFRFGLRRSKASRSAGQQSGPERGISRGQGSLVAGLKDEQCESGGANVPPKPAVLQPATAHGAAPVAVMESKPSLFKRTLSSLSLRSTPKVNTDNAAGAVRPATPANGNRSGESAEGRKHVEGHGPAEADHARKGTALHNLLPRFHGTHHQLAHGHAATGHDGSVEQAAQPSHLPIHLPHLHLPHILEGRSHHPASHHDVLAGAENPAEVMKVLQDATDRAKKIIENARSEHETLLVRARAEAEEEINALRLSLEREDLALRSDHASVEESHRLATTGEENLMRQILDASPEQMAASVALCVEHVLNVDISLAPERRDALRNLKKNPPNFFRKSQAHNYPSVRNSAANRPLSSRQSFSFADHSWDLDPREFTPAGNGTEPRTTVYAAILGERTYNDEDEFQIDFDELDRPSPIKRLSTALQSIQSTCGCFLG